MKQPTLYVECPAKDGFWMKESFCYESQRKKNERCVGCQAKDSPVTMMEVIDICRKRAEDKAAQGKNDE